jgi:hypothetical protein
MSPEFKPFIDICIFSIYYLRVRAKMYKRSVFCPLNKDNLFSLNNNTSISSLSIKITNNFEDSYSEPKETPG